VCGSMLPSDRNGDARVPLRKSARNVSEQQVELRPILGDEEAGNARLAPKSKKIRAATGSGEVSDAGTEVEVNESNHEFHCGGACVTGPPEEDCNFQRAMIFVFVFVFIAYAVVSGLFLFEYFPILGAMPLVYLLLDFLAFCLTGCTDPGVVPPQPDPGVTADPSKRYCTICHVYQEDGQRHCRFCNACIRELDHHCGVTGTCIGARNKVHFSMLFFYYMMSVWSLIIGVAYIAICTTLSSSSGFDGSFPQAVTISARVLGIVLLVLAVVSFAFWFLAYFDLLGRCPCIYNICCCIPGGRRGSNLFITDIEREPGCGPFACLSVPKREFYP